MTEPFASAYARFIVLGQGRTGSTLLVQALNSHPEIMCFGEVFNAAKDHIPYDLAGYAGGNASDLALRLSDYDAFLKTRIFCEPPNGIRAVGFKFHYEHFWHHPGIPEYFGRDVELRVIHLTRRNRLRTLVSTKIADSSGMWFEHQPEPSLASRARPSTIAKALRDPARAVAAIRRRFAPRPTTPVIDKARARSVEVTPEELRLFCERTAYSERHWAGLMAGHKVISVEYERLASERDAVVADVERFLDVEPAPALVTLRRQNPEPLHELITNYTDLRATFAGTDKERFFDD